ncbi:MAG TPA: CidA/LrgA family protein [Solirubrobacteraceae bacterium]|nr:CidA/LrgA family protein [Solirubrobacteraceae bacterium]
MTVNSVTDSARASHGTNGDTIITRGRETAHVLVAIGVLWGFAGAGDLVASTAGLPVPGSVIGTVLLWVALETRLIRLRWIDGGARLLLAALGLLFVPAGAGFVQFIGAGAVWLEVGGIIVVGSLLTLAVTAHVVQRGLPADD